MKNSRRTGRLGDRLLRFEQFEPRRLLAALTFTPYQDAYLENGTRFVSTLLRADASSPHRVSYIEFHYEYSRVHGRYCSFVK